MYVYLGVQLTSIEKYSSEIEKKMKDKHLKV